ncbi:MAG: hypothetical protein ACXWC2_15135 [Ramlibacter sp.]
MATTIWTPVLGWVAAIGAAFAFAVAGPNERGLLGKLPSFTAKRLHDQAQLSLPQQLPSVRTLALVVFKNSQQDEAQGWIDGLRLRQEPAISWVRIPVFSDRGDEAHRRIKEALLLARFPSDEERARLMAVVTDKDAFVRAAGLTSTDHVSVLVLDRSGNVLAKAQGPFDQAKGEALRQTVLSISD